MTKHLIKTADGEACGILTLKGTGATLDVRACPAAKLKVRGLRRKWKKRPAALPLPFKPVIGGKRGGRRIRIKSEA